MTANNPITHGERARTKTNQLMKRQLKERLGGANEEIKSPNLNPTAEMLVAKLVPQAEAIIPQNHNSEINITNQNNQQNCGDRNIGVFTITHEDEKQDENDDRQDDDDDRKDDGDDRQADDDDRQGDDDDREDDDDDREDDDCERQNDGENQNIGVFTITFEPEEQDDDQDDDEQDDDNQDDDEQDDDDQDDDEQEIVHNNLEGDQ